MVLSENSLILIKNILTVELDKVKEKEDMVALNQRQYHLLSLRNKELSTAIDETDDTLTILRREA